MRDYAKSEPKMWHGRTFKALRKNHKALVVGLYLMTSPSSNMLGLFAQPLMYMAYETGLGIEGATEGLRVCVEEGYCSYDEETEFVWVHTMAAKQIAPELKPTDLRCKGIQKEYDGLPDNPFLEAFFRRYQHAFHLTNRRVGSTEISTFSEAPSKPLRSQEQEQEQEQEQAQDQERNTSQTSSAPPPTTSPSVGTLPGIEEPIPDTGIPECPHQRIRAMWAQLLPELQQPVKWSDARAAALRTRWREEAIANKWQTEEDGLKFFARLFRWCRKSNFLMGKGSARTPGQAPFALTLPWLTKAENWAKVQEGNYHPEG